jgi:type IV fimbrial biogenesis protein FimT
MARPPKNRMSGVTLIELMVTVVVLAILVAAAVPSFRDFFDRYRLRGAVDDVVSVISNARAASVKSDTDVSISLAGDTDNWCIGANAALPPAGGNPAIAVAACDCTISTECVVGTDRLVVERDEHDGIPVDSTVVAFTFDSKLGTVVSAGVVDDPDPLTFTSPIGKYEMVVDVNALGQATVCTPDDRPQISGVQICG